MGKIGLKVVSFATGRGVWLTDFGAWRRYQNNSDTFIFTRTSLLVELLNVPL